MSVNNKQHVIRKMCSQLFCAIMHNDANGMVEVNPCPAE